MIEAKSRKYQSIQIQCYLSSNIKYWLEPNLTLTGMLWLKTLLNPIYCLNTKNFQLDLKSKLLLSTISSLSFLSIEQR